jgi:hypothetical protein
MDKATQVAGITTGVLAPYATAAGLGAMATGIPTGGAWRAHRRSGRRISRLASVDLGTALYNLGGSIFGYDSAPAAFADYPQGL